MAQINEDGFELLTREKEFSRYVLSGLQSTIFLTSSGFQPLWPDITQVQITRC